MNILPRKRFTLETNHINPQLFFKKHYKNNYKNIHY